MQITMEHITPAKAEKWLNRNTSNRKLREGVAEKYASDMKHGRWTTCPVPIAFYANGDVADGQHRLWAIVDSGVTIYMPVARGLTKEDGLNIDTGLGRTLVDNAKISGKDTGLTNELLAVCRAIEDGNRKPRGIGAKSRGVRSNAERLDLVTLHREAAQWAVSNGPRGKLLRNALTLSAIGRAWYVETDKDRLKHFCEVFASGLYDSDRDISAIAARNYFLMKGAAATTEAMWRDSFVKLQNAISYFMRGKRLSVIKKVADEAYPMGKSKSKSKAQGKKVAA